MSGTISSFSTYTIVGDFQVSLRMVELKVIYNYRETFTKRSVTWRIMLTK
jgi:hypothetical protein